MEDFVCHHLAAERVIDITTLQHGQNLQPEPPARTSSQNLQTEPSDRTGMENLRTGMVNLNLNTLEPVAEEENVGISTTNDSDLNLSTVSRF
jgi:hypothetical protein